MSMIERAKAYAESVGNASGVYEAFLAGEKAQYSEDAKLTMKMSNNVPDAMWSSIRFLLGTPDGGNIMCQAKSAGIALRELAEVEELMSRLVFEAEFAMKNYRALRRAQAWLDRRNPIELMDKVILPMGAQNAEADKP